MKFDLTHRPRRIRKNSLIRSLFEESSLKLDHLVFPVFISDCTDVPEKIESMPEIFRWPANKIISKIHEWKDLGLNSFALFPHIDQSKKCQLGKEALNPESLIYKICKEIKSSISDIVLIGDLALDPYTTHGHDGILGSKGQIDNDATVDILSRMSILAAEAGYDFVAPSDMMDGRISAIRSRLDDHNFTETGIISYSAKFSSAYYGPFREAIGSSQCKPIDKSSYQLNPRNFREAKRELELDFEEGADILMVKPAEPYLDIISYASNNFNLPISAYQVSGEYSRLWASHLNGWLDLDSCALESLYSIKRAGADIIFTYFAERIASKI